MSQTVEILSDSDLKCVELSIIGSMSSKMLAFAATCGVLGSVSENAQSDRTPLLARPRRERFKYLLKCFVPVVHFCHAG